MREKRRYPIHPVLNDSRFGLAARPLGPMLPDEVQLPQGSHPGDSQKQRWVAGNNQCPGIAPDTNLDLDLAALALSPLCPH